jgi:succinylglutamate desuccinylase
MAQDRTYFRMLSDTALAEAARYCDNDLALVLGERLETLTDAQEELEALQILYDRLVAENNALLDDMAELQAHIDATRGYGPDE